MYMWPFYGSFMAVFLQKGGYISNSFKTMKMENYALYNKEYFSDDHFSYIVRVITWGHGYTSWMHSTHSSTAQARRKFALQGTGLVRTVGPCAQRVALMPQAIELARDMHALLNTWVAQSATHFKRPRPAEQVLATKPRAKREARSVLCHMHTCQ